jgi:hypothetical protein
VSPRIRGPTDLPSAAGLPTSSPAGLDERRGLGDIRGSELAGPSGRDDSCESCGDLPPTGGLSLPIWPSLRGLLGALRAFSRSRPTGGMYASRRGPVKPENTTSCGIPPDGTTTSRSRACGGGDPPLAGGSAADALWTICGRICSSRPRRGAWASLGGANPAQSLDYLERTFYSITALAPFPSRCRLAPLRAASSGFVRPPLCGRRSPRAAAARHAALVRGPAPAAFPSTPPPRILPEAPPATPDRLAPPSAAIASQLSAGHQWG